MNISVTYFSFNVSQFDFPLHRGMSEVRMFLTFCFFSFKDKEKDTKKAVRFIVFQVEVFVQSLPSLIKMTYN